MINCFLPSPGGKLAPSVQLFFARNIASGVLCQLESKQYVHRLNPIGLKSFHKSNRPTLVQNMHQLHPLSGKQLALLNATGQ